MYFDDMNIDDKDDFVDHGQNKSTTIHETLIHKIFTFHATVGGV